MTTYNGWTNWDTWEAFNWLGNDEFIYNSIRDRKLKPPGIRSRYSKWIKRMNKDIKLRLINYVEIHKAIMED